MSQYHDFTVPIGQLPPLAVDTDHDRSASLIIVTTLCLAYVLLFVTIRIAGSCMFRHRFSLDDAFIGVATVFSAIESIFILCASHAGLGKSIELIPVDNRDTVQKYVYASQLFFTVTLGLSKIAVALFLLRLTPIESQRLVFVTAACVFGVWTIASTFALAFQCNIAHPWQTLDQACPNSWTRWAAIGAFDIVTEVGLVGMALFLVWRLSTSISSKVTVVSAFAVRLLIVIPIACRLSSFTETGLTKNPSFSQITYLLWTQAEQCWALISATIPTLRPFVKSFTTYYGRSGGKSGLSSSSGKRMSSGFTKSNKQTASYELSDMKRISASQALQRHLASATNMTSEGRAWERLPDNYPSHIHSSARHARVDGDEGIHGLRDEIRGVMVQTDVEWAVHDDRSGVQHAR